jgi:integrase
MGKVSIKSTNKWTITQENGQYSIRRWVLYSDDSRKLERLPIEQYRKFRDDMTKLTDLCTRLNYREIEEENAKKAWKVRSAFVDNKLLYEGFKKYMISRADDEKYAGKCAGNVKKWFLDYWYKQKKFDYLHWHKPASQSELADWWLSEHDGELISFKTIKTSIHNLNHFFKFLHQESEGEIPELKFTFPTLTTSRIKKHEWSRKKSLGSKAERRSGQYISNDEFKMIIKNAPREIKSCIYLSYYFGLRRSECLAITKDNLRKGYLYLEKQLKSYDGTKAEYGPLKSRDARKVPHWHKHSMESILNAIEEVELMHPSTLTERWITLMAELNLNYTFHSLRNTFISNAFRDGRNASDIQLAAGHSDLRTTMGYQRDYREMDDEVWTPSKRAS